MFGYETMYFCLYFFEICGFACILSRVACKTKVLNRAYRSIRIEGM